MRAIRKGTLIPNEILDFEINRLEKRQERFNETTEEGKLMVERLK